MLEFLQPLIEIFKSLLHIDVTLLAWAQQWGPQLYLILFLIVFAETGLVVTPFLPGDSLLFAVGALAANPDFLKLEIIIPLLIAAATIGDSTNYFIGRKLGRGLFEKNVLFLKKKYLVSTEKFYADKGIWAISLSRFFPILRTFSPFFAGMSLIPFRKFIFFSFSGSIVWVVTFTLAGYFFGRIEIIQKNFTLLVMGIIAFSLLPLVITFVKSQLQAKKMAETARQIVDPN